MKNRGRLAIKILIFIISLSITLLVIELSLAIFYPQTLEQEEWDPLFKWSNRKGFSGTLRSLDEKDYLTRVNINSLGFRGEEIKATKYRIIIVGDSFTFGSGVEDNETFSSLIEHNLNGKGYDVKVINAGVKGWSPDQYYLFIKHEALKYNPDIIIIGFYGGNDVEETGLLEYRGKIEEKKIEYPSFSFKLKKFFAKNSHLYNFLIVKAMQNPLLDRFLIERGIFAEHYKPFFTRNPADYERDEEKVGVILKETIRILKEKNVSVIILYIPSIEEVSDRYYENAIKLFPNSSIERTRPRNLVLRIGKETNTSIVDLTYFLDEESYFPNDLHWNQKGHSIAAKFLINESLYYINKQSK